MQCNIYRSSTILEVGKLNGQDIQPTNNIVIIYTRKNWQRICYIIKTGFSFEKLNFDSYKRIQFKQVGTSGELSD